MKFTFVISSIEHDNVDVKITTEECKNQEQAGDRLLIMHGTMLDLLHNTKICSTLFDENKKELLSIHS